MSDAVPLLLHIDETKLPFGAVMEILKGLGFMERMAMEGLGIVSGTADADAVPMMLAIPGVSETDDGRPLPAAA